MANLWNNFAKEYARSVKSTLSDEELDKVRNGASEHDFYDANDTTLEAFQKVFGRDPLFLTEETGVDGAEAQAELNYINKSLDTAFKLIRA